MKNSFIKYYKLQIEGQGEYCFAAVTQAVKYLEECAGLISIEDIKSKNKNKIN